MSDMDREIAFLEDEVAGLETTLTDLEAEVLDLHQQVADFKARYDRLVVPLEARLDAAQAAINDLKQEQYRRFGHPLGDYNPQEGAWDMPEDYVPVAEQFRQTWYTPQGADYDPDDGQKGKPRSGTLNPREMNIKKLFRMLARRYHPDLSTDPGERDYRNTLMARINDAYANRNLEALQALARQPENTRIDQPLDTLRLQELKQVHRQLERRIQALRTEKAELQLSDVMRLSLEDKLAQSRGRDLLAEMVRKLEREYAETMVRLEQLRSKLQ